MESINSRTQRMTDRDEEKKNQRKTLVNVKKEKIKKSKTTK